MTDLNRDDCIGSHTGFADQAGDLEELMYALAYRDLRERSARAQNPNPANDPAADPDRYPEQAASPV